MNNIGYQNEYEFVSVKNTNKCVSNIGWAGFEQCQSQIFLQILSKGNIHVYIACFKFLKTLIKIPKNYKFTITHFSQ